MGMPAKIATIRRLSDYFLVGAAGFEPTTCSTQNCRATRLRYTPIFAKTVDTLLRGRQQDRLFANRSATLTSIKQRVGHAIPRGNPVFLGRTGDHFEHALGQPP